MKTIALLGGKMRSCTVQMNRSVEIIGILRIGLENMLSKTNTLRVNYTRIFNFQESRVSLRMEVSEGELPYVPMGRIDVVELPTNNGRISCNCTLTQLQSGQSERIVLRLKDANQREKECQRVFGFFRKILSIPEEKTPKRVGVEKSKPETTPTEFGTGPGFPLDSTRGAQSKEDKTND